MSAALIGFVAPFEVIERDPDGRVRHHVVIAVYAARWTSGEPRPGPEAKEIRWITEPDIETPADDARARRIFWRRPSRIDRRGQA